MAVFVLAVIVGLLLAVLAVVWLRSAEDRRRLKLYVEQVNAEQQLDALTRATIAAMRQVAREASRSAR